MDGRCRGVKTLSLPVSVPQRPCCQLADLLRRRQNAWPLQRHGNLDSTRDCIDIRTRLGRTTDICCSQHLHRLPDRGAGLEASNIWPGGRDWPRLLAPHISHPPRQLDHPLLTLPRSHTSHQSMPTDPSPSRTDRSDRLHSNIFNHGLEP